MAGLTREAILAAEDLGLTEVPVKEWGGSVWVRPLTALERTELEQRHEEDMRVKLVVLCSCDEKGKRIFSSADVELLGSKSWTAVQRVFEAALDLNGMGKRAAANLKKG